MNQEPCVRVFTEHDRDQMEIDSGMQSRVKIRKSNSLIHHINRTRRAESYGNFNSCTNSFDNIKYPLMVETLSKVREEGNILNL